MHPLKLSSSQEWLCQTVLSIIVIIIILITKVTFIKVIVNQTKIVQDTCLNYYQHQQLNV